MIQVTCLDGRVTLVNADQIETIEQTPDTIISFTSGHKLLVRDHPDELARRVLDFRRAIQSASVSTAPVASSRPSAPETES